MYILVIFQDKKYQSYQCRVSSNKMGQVQLQWDEYQGLFSSWIKSLCLSDEMVDCTISAGVVNIPAHRLVLSFCSPYFRALFSSVPRHQHPVIFLRDIDEDILHLLVQYMYSGHISVTEEQLVPLVKAAKSLNINGIAGLEVQVK